MMVPMKKPTHLTDALLVLSSVKSGPCDSSRILALEKEGFGFAVLEAENFAIAADVEFPLSSRGRSATGRQ